MADLTQIQIQRPSLQIILQKASQAQECRYEIKTFHHFKENPNPTLETFQLSSA